MMRASLKVSGTSRTARDGIANLPNGGQVSYLTLTLPAEAPAATPEETAPETVPTCTCGAPLYAGRCMEIGTCETADTGATRGASRASAKYQPAAWTFAGGVD